MNLTGTLWMMDFHSAKYGEVLIGKASDAKWVKVERGTSLYDDCWLHLGLRVEATVEDNVLQTLRAA